MEFSYKGEDGTEFSGEGIRHHAVAASACLNQKYLKTIKYGNKQPNRDLNTWQVLRSDSDWCSQLVLDYGEHDSTYPTTEEVRPWLSRQDSFSSFRSGFEVRTKRLCRRFLLFHHFLKQLGRSDTLASSTTLEYQEHSRGSLLSSFTTAGHLINQGGQIRTESLPAYRFNHSPPASSTSLSNARVQSASLSRLPLVHSGNVQWIDLLGEGSPGLLSVWDNGALMFHRNKSPLIDIADGPLFAPAYSLPKQPTSD